MYKRIGRKIKFLSVLIMIAGAVVSIVTGLNLIRQGDSLYGTNALMTAGIITMIAGPILSWLASFLLYGFGELIDKTQKIHKLLMRSVDISIHNARYLPDTWKCACGMVNDSHNEYCESCGEHWAE